MGEAGGSTVRVFSSSVVECGTSPGGAADDRGWSRFKESQRVRTFFARSGKDHHRSMLCMEEFSAMNGELVTETSEGHWVFATLPCKGQLALFL